MIDHNAYVSWHSENPHHAYFLVRKTFSPKQKHAEWAKLTAKTEKAASNCEYSFSGKI